MAAGYVFDPIYLEHDHRGHPECRERLEAIMDVLEKDGILHDLTPLRASDADVGALTRVHTPFYIERVEMAAASGGGFLDPDTYVNGSSYRAAVRAAGGLMGAVDAVLVGRVENAFALVRPPGHHALAGRGMGFCLFNNVAVAACHALEARGLERVLIIDFDVHHGNGTQDTFYDDVRVLYFSVHQWPHYPGSGSLSETGRGEGKGYTVNVPLPEGVGDGGYMKVFGEILAPVARRFKPQLILVSAGYDGHWKDPLAGMGLSVKGYARLMGVIRGLAVEVCGGGLVMTLEGGYHLEALSYSVLASMRVLLGRDDVVDPLGPSRSPEPDIEELLGAVRETHGLET